MDYLLAHRVRGPVLGKKDFFFNGNSTKFIKRVLILTSDVVMKLPNIFVTLRHGKGLFFSWYLISSEEKWSKRPGVWSACSCRMGRHSVLFLLVTPVPWHPMGCTPNVPHWTPLLLFHCLCLVFGSQVKVIFLSFLIKCLILTLWGHILPCFSNCLVMKCLLSELNLWKYCGCIDLAKLHSV